MKIFFGLIAIALGGCADIHPKQSDINKLIAWNAEFDEMLVEMNFSPNQSFFSLENVIFVLEGVKISQTFEELDNYGAFFVDPKPENIETTGTGVNRVILFSGGDGSATFNIKVSIENARVKSWILSGTDIKNSPVKFNMK